MAMNIFDCEEGRKKKSSEYPPFRLGEIIAQSPGETQALAMKLAKTLRPGAVLALHGELGSGKTCFVQGLAKALGVKEMVNSPTFTIINEYRGLMRLCHIDLYRIKSESELLNLGLVDLLEDDKIKTIEWPEIAVRYLPEDTLHVYFEYVDASRRRIKIL